MAAAWLCCASALAQTAVQLDVRAGLSGHVKGGEWAPVYVTVDNQGKETRGDLVIPPQDAIGDQCEYRVAIDVPPSSRRAFTLYARYLEGGSEITVEFHPEEGRVAQGKGACIPHNNRSRIVLVVSRTAGGLNYITNVTIPDSSRRSGSYSTPDSVIAYAAPDRTTGLLELPDHPSGYSAASAVVLRDVSPREIQPWAQEALKRWVAGGGLLAVVSGPNSGEYRESFIEELAPVSIRGQRTLPHLEAFAVKFGGAIDMVPALVTDGAPKAGATVIVEQDGVPLLSRHRYANGTVYFCAADCAASPLKSEDALLIEMWSDILAHGPVADRWAVIGPLDPAYEGEMGGISAAAVQLPVASWDAFARIGGVLVGYIGLLVGVSLLLRKIDRREWLGVAMLIVIAVCSVTIRVVGKSGRGASFRGYEAGVALARSGSGVAWLDGISGIRTPAAREFSVSTADPSAAMEFVTASHRVKAWPVYQSPDFRIKSAPVDMGGFGAFRVQGPHDLGGAVKCRLVRSGSQVAVTVENGTPHELRYPFLMLHGHIERFGGSVPAGESLSSTAFAAGHLRPPDAERAPESLYELAGHCQASDEKGAAPDAQVRSRLLQQLGSVRDDDPYYHHYSGGWGGSSPAMVLPTAAGESMLLFGAWISPDTPLLEIEGAKQSRTSEILLFVEIPYGSAVIPSDGREIQIGPSLDARGSDACIDENGKIVADPGTHRAELRIEGAAWQRPTDLVLTMGASRAGVRGEVWNYRRGKWDEYSVQPDAAAHRLSPAENYCRWAEGQGVVRIRLTVSEAGEATVGCRLKARLVEASE